MDWFVFILLIFGWFFSLALARENPTFMRKAIYVFFTFTLGTQLLLSGVSFPNGFVSSTVGGVTTQTVVYVNYNAAISGANSQPVLWGIGWFMTLYGIFGLIFVFVESFNEFLKFAKAKKELGWFTKKKGL